MPSGRLAIYLNDHLAGAVAAVELARRSAGSNRGTPLGDDLQRLASELEADRRSLQDMMSRLGVRVDPAKVTLAWIAEKLGRFKLNGSWVSYSPLSRVEELELLSLGVEGKLLLWKALAHHFENSGAARPDLEALMRRARSQRRRLERHRLNAVAEAV